MIESIGSRLAEARKAIGETQESFAIKSGIPLSSLKKYESDVSEPGASALKKAAEAGIGIDYVLTGFGTKLRDVNALTEPPPEPYGAKAPPVDSVLLQEVIEFFDAWLVEKSGSVRIDRSRHGAAISVLYRIAAQSGIVRKEELEQVLAMAA